MTRTEITSHDLKETETVAKNIMEEIRNKYVQDSQSVDKAVVVGLVGDLGSGKTTFSQSVAKMLGVEENVTSPTFIIEKVYHTKDTAFPQFVHIDAYRLNQGRELEVLGFKDLLAQKGTLIFLEWPERVMDILPKDTLEIRFSFVDENTRTISYDL